MKNIVLLCTTALILAACGNTNQNNGPTPPPNNTSSLTAISGTVSEWKQGTATLDLVTVNNQTGGPVVVGNGAVATDGTVSGTLPSASALKAYLAPITQLNPPAQAGCTGQLTFGDSAAQYSLLDQVLVKVNAQNTGSIVPGLVGTADASGTTINGELQQLLYLDRPTSVSGTSSCPKNSLSFNAQLKQGWNVLRTQVSGPATGTTGLVTLQLTNAAALSANWTFVASNRTNGSLPEGNLTLLQSQR